MTQDREAETTERGAGAPCSVDVLIVSYNTTDLLASCLASIEANLPQRDLIDVRIRVYDNASRDASAEMVAKDFPTVELTRSDTNEGFGVANNRLAETSTADYLLLLNSDTVWRTDIVSPLLEELQRDPLVAIVGPRLVFPDGRVQLSSQLAPTLAYELALPLRGTKLRRFGALWDAARVIEATRQSEMLESRKARQTDFLWATCWLISRADVERYGLFDPSFPLYDEDLDACIRMRSHGRTIVYNPDVELIHVGGASSNPAGKFALMRTARAHYYRVHHGRVAELVYRVAVPLAWRLRLTSSSRTPVAG
jgi:N-acetylglucosaminyl-diphospho-decaprenol L-rhamnosyltransferase